MTQQYKIGDTVKVLNSDWPTIIPVGSVCRVAETNEYLGVYLYSSDEGPLYFYETEVELVVDDKPEVGDTVEVTFKDGTVVTGVVKNPNVQDGHFYVGDVVYVAGRGTSTTRIITKAVKKPKVWAVLDDVSGEDYASPTLPEGALVSNHDTALLRVGDKWVDTSNGEFYSPGDLGEVRTIVYIPEVTA